MAIPATTGPAPGNLPGLDGIRAVAVLPVILFHARAPGFGAGFPGADVFFLLSGFLITGRVLAEIDRHGRVDLAAFRRRRMMRPYPAFALMVLSSGTARSSAFCATGWTGRAWWRSACRCR